ncbi:putative DNA gyrase subunit A [Synechococcus phage S-CBWM1]|uniref:Putative DNA gyrase subunit A n=1 Tax=Synechococcus phage S-CBWM1 TaxID=2053653 RepID=A0A3G1L3K5_9CAUD|nr:DNA topoisomerase II [Synechococcus phage S-CBWM1]ATW62757.1 putative DNA gyrase subunit A [Synechococcus phage S-CBWM1]
MTENVNIVEQIQEDYLAYSMAVLLGRAIPDLYDGLIPARRRILQTMLEESLLPSKPYVKCARTTGLTSAYYHPHGSAYGSLISMATSWNNNLPWIDCHGNVGSSVDNPAAERYVENRLRESAIDILLGHKETWETRPNYDGSRKEAVRFDAAMPAILVNGIEGIGVGYATRILPHNLRGIAKAISLLPRLAEEDVMEEMRLALVPDFPTGCDIVEDENLQNYLRTGSGSVRCRAKAEIGKLVKSGKAKDRATLTFTNLPPTLNPEKLGEQIRNAVEKGTLDGVAEVVDESDMGGDRVVVVAKVNVTADSLLPELYRQTGLDSKVSAKTLVIDGNKPVELSPSQVIERWFDWRLGRLADQFAYERGKKEARLLIVLGLISALSQLDAVIAAIRSSANKEAAKVALCGKPFLFSDEQAEAILEMRLRQLTNLDEGDLVKEKNALNRRIKELTGLITDDEKRKVFLLEEVNALAERHGNARRSEIIGGVEPPTSEKISNPSQAANKIQKVVKPRLVKVDMAKGVVTVVKGPRGAMVLEPREKLVVVEKGGLCRKLPHSHKGPVSPTGYAELLLAQREAVARGNNYLVVFKLGEEVRYSTVAGAKMVATTAKGKSLIPEGAELISFGEPFSPQWVSPRKAKTQLLPDNEKPASPGTRGKKLCLLSEIKL